MIPEQRRALEAISLNWTRDLKEVWQHCGYHVEGLHPQAVRLIRQGIREAETEGGPNPLGIALQGEGGVGKTHLLGWTREQVQGTGGYFFLVSDPPRSMFEEQVVETVVEQLRSAPDNHRRPLEILLADLVAMAAPEPVVRDAITGQRAVTPEDLVTFISALRLRVLPNLSIAGLDTARALVLLASPDLDQQDIGARFFSPSPEDDLGSAERRDWSISQGPHSSKLLIAELSRIIAVSGPAVLAVDQIDAIIQKAATAASPGSGRQLLSDVANGLMKLRDLTRRTLIVISCLPDNWELLYKSGVRTARDRFRQLPALQNIPAAAVGRALIETRFAQAFKLAGYNPPYPSWPIRPTAFDDATGYTARDLLRRVDAHINHCLDTQEVRELARLDGESLTATTGAVSDEAQPAADRDFTDLDARFSELRSRADVTGAFVSATEDAHLPGLLAAGLESWTRERGDGDASDFRQDPVPPRNPDLHACLRIIGGPGRQRSWAFRAVASDQPKAVQSRLRKAVEKAGLDVESPDRRLFVLRTPPWPSGPVTDRQVAEFAARGGVSLVMTADDLQTFAALREMLTERPTGLDDWLAARRPAHGTELFARALRDAGQAPGIPVSSEPLSDVRSSAGHRQPEVRPRPPREQPTLRVGSTMIGDAPVTLDLESLCKHVSVFAGAGSGKTVLLRRIVEESALLGISSIVIDRQNDLARLGTPWPSPPPEWGGADPDRAREYLAETDVLIWTPGRNGGRPLSFQPLPVFSDILSDPDERRAEDEFRAAVDTTIEILAPLVRADKATVKADAEQAVLREALAYFGHSGGGDLDEFITLLSDLPDEASSAQKAAAIGASLASALRNAKVNDPLLAGAGEPADPGMLLRPPPGKRARVSVISMVGLPEMKQQQSFVNQLQLALFSWVRKNPAREQSLAWLFVMDEARDFVPSDSSPPSKQATIQLASQSRKYGLGMLFATQHPNAVHNSVTNNSATQFYGRLGSRAAVETVRNLARARGGDLPGIGRMKKGQFYIGTEGSGFRKIRTSMCLSHHPPGPLTGDEVIELSRNTD